MSKTLVASHLKPFKEKHPALEQAADAKVQVSQQHILATAEGCLHHDIPGLVLSSDTRLHIGMQGMHRKKNCKYPNMDPPSVLAGRVGVEMSETTAAAVQQRQQQ